MIDFNFLPRFKDRQFEILCLISEWARAYEVEPAAIERQIPIAHAWANANRRGAPRRDCVRFLFNWMRKAKEYGNLRVPAPAAPRLPEAEPDLTFEEAQAIRRKNLAERPRINRGAAG